MKAQSKTTLDFFEDRLDFFGFAEGANGASYKNIEYGTSNWPAIQREYHGQRDIIVGYNGERFANRDAALLWARMDQGRRIIPGATFPERPEIY